jgi:hypothetical protein
MGCNRPSLPGLTAHSPDMTLARDSNGWFVSIKVRCGSGDEEKIEVLQDWLLEHNYVRGKPG